MIDDKPAVPLSPPTSPHMSDTGAKIHEYQWQHAPDALLPTTVSTQPPQTQEPTPIESIPLQEELATVPVEEVSQHRPPLRSHKSFPYSLGPSSRATDDFLQHQTGGNVLGDFQERVVSLGPQPTSTSALPQPSFGGSAPTSPVGRLTPHSPNQEQDDTLMEDDDLELEDAEPDEEVGRAPKTAAELRAQKRKMKRFRLTHNQTRFLMSEFARQAHPDAAHRERLSREIPGLSPRQVQVWFQNRRAKLKRLTTDDRESMMRSRALPAGFDMTQALHAPFGAPTASVTTPSVSPQTFAPYGGSAAPAPLTIDTLRRSSQYQPYTQQYASPTGATPALGTFAFTPPQSATDTLSPASVAGNTSAFNFPSADSSRRYGYGSSTGAPPSYTNHASNVPRLHMHERLTRPAIESVGSPLRASMSYSALNAGASTQTYGERSNSFSEQSSYTHERTRQSRANTNSSLTGSGPYGLGFSCRSPLSKTMQFGRRLMSAIDAPMSGYQTTAQTQPSVVGTTTNTNTPATLDQFRRNSTQLTGTPITSYASYTTPNYASTPVPQYSYWNTGYGGQASYASYAQVPGQHNHRDTLSQTVTQQPQQTYTPMVSQSHQFGALMGSPAQSQEQGDNSDGGVPVNTTF